MVARTTPDLRPRIPWVGLLVCGLGFLVSVGLLGLGLWLAFAGYRFAGIVLALIGAGWICVLGRELLRMLWWVRRREAIGRERQERLDRMEQELAELKS